MSDMYVPSDEKGESKDVSVLGGVCFASRLSLQIMRARRRAHYVATSKQLFELRKAARYTAFVHYKTQAFSEKWSRRMSLLNRVAGIGAVVQPMVPLMFKETGWCPSSASLS
jgi:hypothetical protein